MYQESQTRAAGRCRQLALDVDDPVGKTLLVSLAKRIERQASAGYDNCKGHK
jgi:hypothetical protein